MLRKYGDSEITHSRLRKVESTHQAKVLNNKIVGHGYIALRRAAESNLTVEELNVVEFAGILGTSGLPENSTTSCSQTCRSPSHQYLPCFVWVAGFFLFFEVNTRKRALKTAAGDEAIFRSSGKSRNHCPMIRENRARLA